ncbi:MAG TPA: polysaccharide biosynthesis protein [Terracidiphilus sp.]
MPKIVGSDRAIDFELESLLGRKPIQLDQSPAAEYIQGRSVMVTGAAGSIGSELCRQLAAFNPRELIGMDQAETPLFYLENELKQCFSGLKFQTEICSVSCAEDVNRVTARYRPSVVFHAAGYKHVSLLERHPLAAVENNIFGTWNVAQAAALHSVEHFVLISTDKAVRPVSIMGATKRVAELAIRALRNSGPTKFVVVRFGNVLGSSGSVVPIFLDQIAAGGPVTVTDPEMTRYFMTAHEAGQLVLQAVPHGKSGEILVLDMGEPTNILDLARKLISLSERKIEIEFIGARRGEKISEELSFPSELPVSISNSPLLSIAPSEEDGLSRFEVFLHELGVAKRSGEVLRVIAALKEMVPEYEPASAPQCGERSFAEKPVGKEMTIANH